MRGKRDLRKSFAVPIHFASEEESRPSMTCNLDGILRFIQHFASPLLKSPFISITANTAVNNLPANNVTIPLEIEVINAKCNRQVKNQKWAKSKGTHSG
jgi:hypothetical protein